MGSAPDFVGFAGNLHGAVNVLAHLGTMINALLGACLGGFQSKPRYALKNMAEFRNLIDCCLHATAVLLVDPVKKE
jgi:hypothetical protein